jgi:hypothetical protein
MRSLSTGDPRRCGADRRWYLVSRTTEPGLGAEIYARVAPPVTARMDLGCTLKLGQATSFHRSGGLIATTVLSRVLMLPPRAPGQRLQPSAAARGEAVSNNVTTQDAKSDGRARRTALSFVVLIGILSFFADFTYEGSRSIIESVSGHAASNGNNRRRGDRAWRIAGLWSSTRVGSPSTSASARPFATRHAT